MSIYRGAGGAGDAVADSSSEALLVRELSIEVQADADAAAASATNSSNSATAASSSASAASTSASNAATSATNASNSASSASTSATNAANSATAAQTAETAAELAEINAETAQAAAASSASSASTSATNASNSATAAAGSATAASSAADAALAALDSFDDRYLGQKSTAPTVDNDGNALVTGSLYFNTTTNEMKVWDGSQWLNAYASLSNALLVTNNLSDLNNTATARTNLGVAIGTNVQAYDADLATIAGLTPTNNYAIIGNGTSWTSSALPSSGVTSVTGTSPVASSGGTTPAISLSANYGDTLNPYSSKTANFILAAPNGSAGTPTFRAVVAADIPTLNQNTTGTSNNVTGTVAIANGGTGATTAANALTALGAYPSSNPSGYTSNVGTVTSVATGNGLSGGTITGTGTLVIACPGFNTVGSYCFIQFGNGNGTTTNLVSGDNYAAGNSPNGIQTASISDGANFQQTNNLSGTWKWLGASSLTTGLSFVDGIGCRVS